MGLPGVGVPVHAGKVHILSLVFDYSEQPFLRRQLDVSGKALGKELTESEMRSDFERSLKTLLKRRLLPFTILILGSIAYGFTLYKVCNRVFRDGRRSARVRQLSVSDDREEVDRLLRLLEKPTPFEELTAGRLTPKQGE